jgi:hypothetical protein
MLDDELEAAYKLISDMPFAGEPVPHSEIAGLRRVLLRRDAVPSLLRRVGS